MRVRNLDGNRDQEGCDVPFVENHAVRGENFLLGESREKRVLSVGGVTVS